MNEESKPSEEGTKPTESSPEVQVSEPLRSLPEQPTTEQDFKKVERELNAFERSTLRWTKANFVILAVTCAFIGFQWVAMRETLNEMRRSGDTATYQLWQAIGNMNWMARTADGSLHQTREAMEANQKQNQAALDASIKTARYQLRPYISARTMHLSGTVNDGVKFSGKVNILNSGQTPAVKIEACGDILLTPFGKPITDDWPCPSPDNPKQDRELSVTVLGTGGSIDISSPGVILNTGPLSLDTLLSTKQGRVYFYGYVTYHDLLDVQKVHHTTFCGLYNPDVKMWMVCEKHNNAD